MRRLIHYGTRPLTTIYSVPQNTDSTLGIGKPSGLWVSAEGEDDWQSWCRDGNFGLKQCQTEVILKPDHKVLELVGVDAIDSFHAKYSVVGYKYGSGLGERLAIDWVKVAAEYQGIVIAPYVWSRRLMMDSWGKGSVSDWYYGWDCASGCIWDAEAVAELRAI